MMKEDCPDYFCYLTINICSERDDVKRYTGIYPVYCE